MGGVLARLRYGAPMTRTGSSALALTLVVAAVAVVAIVSDDDGGAAPSPQPASVAARAADPLVEATCSTGMPGRLRRPHANRNALLGPLILVGGKGWALWQPQGYNGHGYKIPASLLGGAVVTLSVPEAMQGRVGLVYTPEAQNRVLARGVKAADTAVRFTACPSSERKPRTGWRGGLVVDRPRCVTLVATLADGTAIRRRLPLGRLCST